MQNRVTFSPRKEKQQKKQDTQKELSTHPSLSLVAGTTKINKERSNHITDTLANQGISKRKITK